MSAPVVRALAIVTLLATTTTGCFTTWVGLRAAGLNGAVNEGVREERVPLPGIQEQLVVKLESERVTATDFRFTCSAEQYGRDAVYRSSYRYGKGWKTSTAIMFVAEAALSAVFLLTEPKMPENKSLQVAGGVFFGIDAIGTAALFFIPRKDVYERTELPVTTPIRSACPDGVMVEISGDTFPLDANGSLGELGSEAFDQWMRAPNGSILVSLAGRTARIDVTDTDRCAWQRSRTVVGPAAASTVATAPTAPATAPSVASACGSTLQPLVATLDLPVGTLGIP
jgi:hypothetical protein